MVTFFRGRPLFFLTSTLIGGDCPACFLTTALGLPIETSPFSLSSFFAEEALQSIEFSRLKEGLQTLVMSETYLTFLVAET